MIDLISPSPLKDETLKQEIEALREALAQAFLEYRVLTHPIIIQISHALDQKILLAQNFFVK